MSFTEDIAKYFKKANHKKPTSTFHTFWDDTDSTVNTFLNGRVEKTTGKDFVQLAGYKRAIANFVSIVTGKSIPVTFNSNNQSYTNGKKVTIGANLTDKNFDSAVGLALHEGSHILLSDFDLLKGLHTKIPQALFDKGETKKLFYRDMNSLVKNVLNYVEDRRIDNFIFSTSPGYKGYYHAMYDKYFYSKLIDKGLKSPEYRNKDMDSYMFRLINLHNKNRQLNALPGLDEIWKILDLRNIDRLKNSGDVLQVALDITNVIVDNLDMPKDEKAIDENPNPDLESREGGNDSAGNDPSQNDDGSEPKELSEKQKEQLKKQIEKQEKFIAGEPRKTKLTKKDSKTIKAIEESDAKYENVGNGCASASFEGSRKGTKCLVVKNLTKGIIDSGHFGCAKIWNENSKFVTEGLRLGNILGRKLQIRSEERITKFTRKDGGKIDKRLIAELGFNNTNIFSQTLVDRYNKAYLHISIDASSSMYGKKWDRAMTSAIAMIKACDMASNIEVVVSIRSTHKLPNNKVPLIMVVYDSRKDKLTKVKSLFKYLGASGTTPEGLCFEAIMKDLIPGNDNQDSYFLNYSDGQPYFGNDDITYFGEEAAAHTKRQVDAMKNNGIKIMSYFIGGSDFYGTDMKDFKVMYGKDASFINAINMMQVAKTMNKKFLER